MPLAHADPDAARRLAATRAAAVRRGGALARPRCGQGGREHACEALSGVGWLWAGRPHLSFGLAWLRAWLRGRRAFRRRAALGRGVTRAAAAAGGLVVSSHLRRWHFGAERHADALRRDPPPFRPPSACQYRRPWPAARGTCRLATRRHEEGWHEKLRGRQHSAARQPAAGDATTGAGADRATAGLSALVDGDRGLGRGVALVAGAGACWNQGCVVLVSRGA